MCVFVCVRVGVCVCVRVRVCASLFLSLFINKKVNYPIGSFYTFSLHWFRNSYISVTHILSNIFISNTILLHLISTFYVEDFTEVLSKK